jgi:hypothetical protein
MSVRRRRLAHLQGPRAGFSGVRNPWPGEPFDVITEEEDQHRIAEANAGTFFCYFECGQGSPACLRAEAA